MIKNVAKTRIRIITLIVLLLTLLGCGGYVFARAESADSGGVTDKAEQDSGSLTEWFKNDALPYVISAAGGAGGFLLAFFPLIKIIGKNKKYQGSLGVASKLIEELRAEVKAAKEEAESIKQSTKDFLAEKLKEAQSIDYAGIIKDAASEVLKPIELTLADFCTQVQIVSEKQDMLVSGARVMWGKNNEVRSMLTMPPTTSGLKRKAFENERLKDEIRRLKGDEAEEVLIRVEEETDKAIKGVLDEPDQTEEVNNEESV